MGYLVLIIAVPDFVQASLIKELIFIRTTQVLVDLIIHAVDFEVKHFLSLLYLRTVQGQFPRYVAITQLLLIRIDQKKSAISQSIYQV
jgi:hypothetical protein